MATLIKVDRLLRINTIEGKIKLLSGLHIGSGDSQMKIGGIDNDPFIPGSSLKGKMRTLLEWHLGFYKISKRPKDDKDDKDQYTGEPSNLELFKEHVKQKAPNQEEKLNLVKLFGSKPNAKGDDGVISRLSFCDCKLINTGRETSEEKTENAINRATGTTGKGFSPRSMERVPEGNEFTFKLALKIFDTDSENDMCDLIKAGLLLLQLDALGGSGSRGYGKIEFQDLEYRNPLETEPTEFELDDDYLSLLV